MKRMSMGSVRDETGVDGGADALADLGQLVVAGDLPEPLRIQGVQAHVDAVQARRLEVAGEAGEQDAVGGHGQDLQAVRARRTLLVAGKAVDEIHAVPAHQGFPSREPHLAPAEADGDPHQSVDLLEGQDLLPFHVDGVRGHAVRTPQVAPVGDRDAEVGDFPPEGIDERHEPFLVVEVD
jgi:hypothetical protein